MRFEASKWVVEEVMEEAVEAMDALLTWLDDYMVGRLFESYLANSMAPISGVLDVSDIVARIFTNLIIHLTHAYDAVPME